MAQRKTRSVLVTDVESSTRLQVERGDDAAGEILEVHHDAVRREVSRHDGEVVKWLGDGCLASFPSARAALACANEIQRAIAAHNAAEPDRALRVRIGINAGEVSEQDGDIRGQAVSGAARIADQAAGGEILVSRVVRDLAGSEPGLEFHDRGAVTLRGFPQPWELFEVRARETAAAAVPGIGILGPLTITTPEGAIERGGRQERILLAALATHPGRALDTDQLADALWGDQPPRSAAKVVQNVVLRVRKVLGPRAIETRPNGYALDVSAVTVDSARFDELISSAREAAAQAAPERASALLVEARSLWRGPPLPELGDWPPAQAEAARLLELRNLTREEWAAAELAAGRHAAVLAELQAMVREEPLRERGWALLMTALYRTGRQADALRAYQEARMRLVEELGVEPGTELRDLESAILAHDDELGAPRPRDGTGRHRVPPALPPVLASYGGPFVGRVGEMDRLRAAWKHALDGEKRFALVSGEPGVGKTRLAAELARRVHSEGGVVMFGRCDEEPIVPYQPFTEALRSYVAACAPGEFAERVGSHAGDLIRLLPELAQRLPSAPQPLQADPDTERYRLFEAVAGQLDAAAARAPLLLVLDDLHWAAKPTLLLLRHVARAESQRGLLVLGTYRETELVRGHALSGVLANLRREANVEWLLLEGLDEEAVTKFILAADRPTDADAARLARAVFDRTEGNPFFVEQLLRHLLESDDRDVGIPEGVREVIRHRLDQLDEDTNTVLGVAAVIGRDFDPAVLTTAAETDTDRVLTALEQAEVARLVEPTGGTPPFTFVHALVRSTLYDGIPSARRLRFHRQVAHALEQDDARNLAALAHHYCEAASLGDGDRAVRYAAAAGAQALEHLAYEEAADLYKRALAVLDVVGDERGQRGELLIGLARARWAMGERDRARQSAYEAARHGRDTDQPELLADAAFVIGGGNQAWSESGVIDEALLSLCEEALERLPAGDSARCATVTARLARELYYKAGTAERRHALAGDALAMARRLGDPATLAYTLGSAHYVDWGPGTSRSRLAIAEEILQLGQDSGQREVEYGGASWAFMDLMELGETSRADKMLAVVRTVVDELRQPQYLWMAHEYETARALMDGRLDDAARLAEEALAYGQAAQSQSALQYYGAVQIELARARGGLEDLTVVAAAMVEQYPLVPAWRCALVYLNALLERPGELRPHFELLAADDFEAIRRDANWMVAMAMLVTASAAVGDHERSARLYELLLPYREYCVTAMPTVTIGSAETFLAIAAATAGGWEAAEQHFAIGISRNEEIGCRTWVVNGTYEYARSLARRRDNGDRERLGDLVRSCVTLGNEMGMTRVVAEAKSLANEARIRLE